MVAFSNLLSSSPDRLKDVCALRKSSFLPELPTNNSETNENTELIPPSKILLIDDCEVTRTIISSKLARNGFEIFQASSGQMGLEVIEKIDPDLILLDVIMQGIDGMETCRRFKKIENLSEVPIIFLSGKAEKENVIEGFKLGAADYITKPFDPNEAVARIKTHLKIRHLNKEREKALEEAKKATASKKKILEITSHDLKNPLAAIRGLTEYLLNGEFGELNEDQTEVIGQILDASGGMIDLVSDLLSLSILEGACKTDRTEQDLVTFATQLARQFITPAANKNIDIAIENEEPLPPISFDDKLIRRVVQNLVGNAVKFSPKNTTITVRVREEKDVLFVEIDDQGPGVAEAEQHKLFTEYGQTSNKTTAGESSTGLGLSICKKIVEAHKGTIGMYNLPKLGARFYFSIPRK